MSIDRGSLYDRAKKKQEMKKLNNEAVKDKEEQEVAACSFQPNISKSMITFRGNV